MEKIQKGLISVVVVVIVAIVIGVGCNKSSSDEKVTDENPNWPKYKEAPPLSPRVCDAIVMADSARCANSDLWFTIVKISDNDIEQAIGGKKLLSGERIKVRWLAYGLNLIPVAIK